MGRAIDGRAAGGAAVAEAKVLVDDVADSCASSGLVRRGDRVRNVYPGYNRVYCGLQPYAP